MKRYDRLHGIMELVAARGSVDVADIAEEMAVSVATVRRDLDHLADQQLIRRTRGGAVSHDSVSYELPLRYRTGQRASEKQRIGQRAAELVTPGMVVGINGGTTTIEVARALGARADLLSRSNGPALTVVTNAVNIAYELSVRPHVKLLITGGVARPQTYELVGPFAESTVDALTLDLAFIGADGIDSEFGISARDEQEARVNGSFVKNAQRVAVVVDSTKLGQRGFVRICQVAEVDIVVTDTGADPAHAQHLADAGVEVLYV